LFYWGVVIGWIKSFWQAALRRLGLAAAAKHRGWFGRVGDSDPEDLRRLIEKYREEHSPFRRELPLNSGGGKISPEGRNSGGVAVTVIDGKPVFGVDFRHHTYTSADLAAAERMSAILAAKYPDLVNRGDRQKPRDATGRAYDAQPRDDELQRETMKKEAYFDSQFIDGWPRPEDIESYFLFAPRQSWPFEGNDSASFDVDGVDGTDLLPERDPRRSSISLALCAHPILGVFLEWSKWNGERQEAEVYVSRGDFARLGQFVWDQHGSLHPVAMFIPYPTAWKALKEFLQTDGALPTSIEWVGTGDLAPDTFIDPPTPRFEWKKVTDFAGVITKGWREPQDIEHYFLGPPGQRWFFDTGTDKASFEVHGASGTDHFPPGEGRIDIKLTLWGHPTLGVLFNWAKWGGGFDEIYASKGDVARLRERAERVHGGTLPVGLFVPYEAAWKALNEFFETDGALPKSIEWIAERDLPPEFRRKHKR
jgi:hypothetical protein